MVDDRPEDGASAESSRPRREPPTIDLQATAVSEAPKAEAKEALVKDIDGQGKAIERPALINDFLPSPYPNKKAAAAANSGAAPPDLSFMALARHQEEDYIFYLLTGFVWLIAHELLLFCQF